MTKEEIERRVYDSIRKTINKFREHPYYFFTEADILSYLYYCLYSKDFEQKRDDKRIFLIHKEYPTNFRYIKKELNNPDFTEPFPLNEKRGTRGNYDMVIINPQFIENARSCEDIVNKNVRLLEKRVENNLESVKKELLFAIEAKYIVRKSRKFLREVKVDNKKLMFAKIWGATHAINLVFCNIEGESYIEKIRQEVIAASKNIDIIFIQSYYEKNKKITPKPLANNDNIPYIREC